MPRNCSDRSPSGTSTSKYLVARRMSTGRRTRRPARHSLERADSDPPTTVRSAPLGDVGTTTAARSTRRDPRSTSTLNRLTPATRRGRRRRVRSTPSTAANSGRDSGVNRCSASRYRTLDTASCRTRCAAATLALGATRPTTTRRPRPRNRRPRMRSARDRAAGRQPPLRTPTTIVTSGIASEYQERTSPSADPAIRATAGTADRR